MGEVCAFLASQKLKFHSNLLHKLFHTHAGGSNPAGLPLSIFILSVSAHIIYKFPTGSVHADRL